MQATRSAQTTDHQDNITTSHSPNGVLKATEFETESGESQTPVAVDEEPGFGAEIVSQFRLAFPVCCGMMCARLIAATSVAMVGHISESLLAAAALATTLANVSGNSVMVGMSIATSTLAGQSWGAGNKEEVGLVCQRSLIILGIGCIPISIAWCFVGRLLEAIGLDAELARQAGEYIIFLIPSLWGFAAYRVLSNYLSAQRHTRPAALAGLGSLIACLPINILFIQVFKLGFIGAALAYSLVQALMPVLMVLYCAVTGAHKETWGGWSPRALQHWGPFLRLALPGILMLSEWWASEINIFMSGYLPDSDHQVATMSIYQTTIGLAFMIPVGIQVATTVRVSNEMGRGDARAAQRASKAGITLGGCLCLVEGLLIYAARWRWGRVFTSSSDLVDSCAGVLAVAAVYVVGDGTCSVLGGVLSGMGRQAVQSKVVLFSYYVVGLPTSYMLAFKYGLGTVGLASGLCIGTYVHCAIYATLVLFTDWDRQVRLAQERVSEAAGRGGEADKDEEVEMLLVSGDDDDADRKGAL